MAIKALYASAEEIPSGAKEFYVERNGQWFLDAEGVEDVSGLKNALNSERDSVKLLKAKLAELEPLKERAAEMAEIQAKLDEIEDGELLKKGKSGLDAIVAKRTKRVADDAESKIRAAAEAKAAAEQVAAESVAKLRAYHMTSEVTKAAVKAGVRPTAIRDVVRAAGDVFAVGDDMTLVGRDNTLTDKKGNPVTLDTWFRDVLPDDAPHYWESDVGGGGRGGAGGGVRTVSRRDQAALDANFEAIRDGKVTVVD